jgi:hypothetical protein
MYKTQAAVGDIAAEKVKRLTKTAKAAFLMRQQNILRER